MLTEQILLNMYKSGLSMRQISIQLGCSENKVVYWMKKYHLQRRTRSEATYLQFNPKGDPFSIKQSLKHKENMLLGLGLGIFWGEGTKVSRHSVRITNTDPAMILIFRKFLLEICGVKRDKIRYSLIGFQDIDINTMRLYWAKLLQISPEKFGKITQIPSQGKGTYKRKSKYGVCILYVNNHKLKSWFNNKLAEVKQMPD